MGNAPSIDTECMMGSDWHFVGVQGCPDDPLNAPLDPSKNLGCTSTIPTDSAGYCVCDDLEYRVVRCHDVPSTCETLCPNEQRKVVVDEVARHRRGRADAEGDDDLPRGAMYALALGALGLVVAYLLTSSSRGDAPTTGDRLDAFMRRRHRDEARGS